MSMAYPKFIVSTQKEESISIQRGNYTLTWLVPYLLSHKQKQSAVGELPEIMKFTVNVLKFGTHFSQGGGGGGGGGYSDIFIHT